MAASQKLRDWRDDLIEGSPLPVVVVDSLLAVVEAAERTRDYAELEDDAHLLDALDMANAALAALDEALTVT